MELKIQMFGFRRRLQPMPSSKEMIVTADHEREESYPDNAYEHRNNPRSNPATHSSHLTHVAPSHPISNTHAGAQSLQQQVRLINISGNPNGAPPGRQSQPFSGNQTITEPYYMRFE
jgi:hypothetical protein